MSWSRCWFQICFMFTPIWGRFPFWLICFKAVETTDQWLLRTFEPPGSLITYAALITACGKCDQWRQVNRTAVAGGTAQCTKGTLSVVLIEIFQIPMGSMYGLLTCIYHKNRPNVAKYTIHGSYGIIYLLLENFPFYKLHTLNLELVQNPNRPISPGKWQYISKEAQNLFTKCFPFRWRSMICSPE